MEDRCLLSPSMDRCCCKCKYLLEHYRIQNRGIPKRDGWVCIAFAFEEGEGRAFSRDHQHSLCELFRPR